MRRPRTGKAEGPSGWLTPTAGDAEGPESPEKVLDRRDNVGRLKDQAQFAKEGSCAKNQDGPVYAVYVPAGWQTPLARDVKGGCGGGRIRDGQFRAGGLDQMAQTVMPSRPKTAPMRRNRPPMLPIEGLTDAEPQILDEAPETEEERPPKTALAERLENARIPETLGPTLVGSIAGTARSARLNPAFSRWLMGFPKGWDSCGATAMRSFRRSRRGS